jgi:hypothetical protein
MKIQSIKLKQDTIFRSVNAIGLAANIVAQFLPLHLPARGCCKAISAGCNFVSFVMVRHQLHKDRKEKQYDTIELMKMMGRSLLMQAGPFVTLSTDILGIAPVLGEPNILTTPQAVMLDGTSMGVQALHLYGGSDPDETSLHKIIQRQKQKKRLGQFNV